jgi:hypothetical protein
MPIWQADSGNSPVPIMETVVLPLMLPPSYPPLPSPLEAFSVHSLLNIELMDQHSIPPVIAQQPSDAHSPTGSRATTSGVLAKVYR